MVHCALAPPGGKAHPQRIRLGLILDIVHMPADERGDVLNRLVGKAQAGQNAFGNLFAVVVMRVEPAGFAHAVGLANVVQQRGKAQTFLRRSGGACTKAVLQHVVAVLIRTLFHAARKVELRYQRVPNVQLVDEPQGADG
ncbi:hypothetical protein SDC9_68624 [bioreactor metagenome]|uniref:Uncharacterized protein n=1 Tax=bioreactor metagenome TaxID=1076179 RepID=A0A644Y6I1_9ZZZZ